MNRTLLTVLALLPLGCAGAPAPPPSFSLNPSIETARDAFIAGEAPTWDVATPRIWVELCPPGQACASLAMNVNREGEELAIRGAYVAHGHGMYGAWLPSVYGALVDANTPVQASPTSGSFRAFACDAAGCRVLVDDAAAPTNPTTRVVLPYVERALARVGPELTEESDEEMFMSNRIRALEQARLHAGEGLQLFVETGTEQGIAPSTHVAGSELHALMPAVHSSISRGAQGPAIAALLATTEGALPHAERVHTFWPPGAGRRRVHILRGDDVWVIDLPVCGPIPEPLRAFAAASADVARLAAEATSTTVAECPVE